MKVNEDEIIFSTGKKIYANGGIVGIANDELRIYYGYDGLILEAEESPPDFDDCITKDEAVELCNHMIDVWQKKLASLGTED